MKHFDNSSRLQQTNRSGKTSQMESSHGKAQSALA